MRPDNVPEDLDAVRRALAAHPVHEIAPVGAPYVWGGRFHRNRVSSHGYELELRYLLKERLRPTTNPRKLLILARPRSGSTLRVRLLNQVEGMTCQGERLNFAVFSPAAFLDRIARLSCSKAYGGKLLSYQMLEIQKMRDPLGFFEDIIGRGFKLVHLRRNTFDQALSLSTAQAGGLFHAVSDRDADENGGGKIDLDPAAFLHQYRWNEAMLNYEEQMMNHLPHVVVDYNKDLADATRHQATIDRICAHIDIASTPVRADLRKIGSSRIGNVDTLRHAVEEARLTA